MGSFCTPGPQQTTQSYTPAPQTLQAFYDIYGRASALSNQGTPAYSQNVANSFLSPEQQLAIGNINSAYGSALPWLQTAAQYGQQGAQDVSQLSAADINKYMNPYVQNVVNATQANLGQQFANQMQQITGNATAQGALGGSRDAVAKAEALRQFQTGTAPTIANLYSQGYQQAVGTAQSQQAVQAANLARQQQAGYFFGNLAPALQNSLLQGAQAQMGAGGVQQNAWQQATAYPYQQLSWLAGLTSPFLSALGGSQTGTMQPSTPSLFQDILGLGATAAAFMPGGGGKAAHGGRVMGYAGGGSVPDIAPIEPYQFAPMSEPEDAKKTKGMADGGPLGASPFGGGFGAGYAAFNQGIQPVKAYKFSEMKQNKMPEMDTKQFQQAGKGLQGISNMFGPSSPGAPLSLGASTYNPPQTIGPSNVDALPVDAGGDLGGLYARGGRIHDDFLRTVHRLRGAIQRRQEGGEINFADRWPSDLSPVATDVASADTPFRLSAPEELRARRKEDDRALGAEGLHTPYDFGRSAETGSALAMARPEELQSKYGIPDIVRQDPSPYTPMGTRTPVERVTPTDIYRPAIRPEVTDTGPIGWLANKFGVSPADVRTGLLQMGASMLSGPPGGVGRGFAGALQGLGYGLGQGTTAMERSRAQTMQNMMQEQQFRIQQQQIQQNQMVPRKLGTDPNTGFDIYGVRDPNSPTGYKIIDMEKLLDTGAPAAPAVPGVPAPTTATTAGTPTAVGTPPAVVVAQAGQQVNYAPVGDQPNPLRPGPTEATQFHDPANEKITTSAGATVPLMAKRRYGMDPQTLRDDAERYRWTGTYPPGMKGKLAGAQQTMIRNEAGNLDKAEGISAQQRLQRWQDYTVQRANIRAMTTGRQGDTVRSLGVAVDHAETLMQMALALKQSNIPMFNAIANAWAKQTGQTAPVNFEQAQRILGPEIIKALGVQGAGTDRERQAALVANVNASKDQIIDSLQNVVRPMLGAQMDGLRRQWITSTGRSGGQFDQMLFPSSREYLSHRDTGIAHPTNEDQIKSLPANTPYIYQGKFFERGKEGAKGGGESAPAKPVPVFDPTKPFTVPGQPNSVR